MWGWAWGGMSERRIERRRKANFETSSALEPNAHFVAKKLIRRTPIDAMHLPLQWQHRTSDEVI